MHVLLAPLIIGPPPGPDYVVDHRDGNGLNNQGYNFRWLTSFENRWKYARIGCQNPAHA